MTAACEWNKHLAGVGGWGGGGGRENKQTPGHTFLSPGPSPPSRDCQEIPCQAILWQFTTDHCFFDPQKQEWGGRNGGQGFRLSPERRGFLT